MTEVRQDAADIISSIRSLLGIEGALDELDPAGFGAALGRFGISLAGHPAEFFRAAMEYSMRSAQATVAMALRGMGLSQENPVELEEDRRFADPAWASNPAFSLLRQQYVLLEG